MGLMDNIYPDAKQNSLENQMNHENKLINSYSAIPQKITKSDVIKLGEKTGELQAEIELMKLWSEQSLNLQSQALKALELKTGHNSQSMKNQQIFRKKMSQYGKEIEINNLVNQTIQSNFDKFKNILESASDSIEI